MMYGFWKLIGISLALTSWIGIICGLYSNFMVRKSLKSYKENYFAKFRTGILYGLIMTWFNFYYLVGIIFSLGLNGVIFPGLGVLLLLTLIPIYYTIMYMIARALGDWLFGKSPSQPLPNTNNPLFREGFQAVFHLLEVNLNAPFGKLKHRWAMPSAKYMAAYLWDSAFISLVWKYWDMKIASEILLPLLDNQAADGRIPHFASFLSQSNMTQPPLIAWAITNLEVDSQYLKKVYPKLKKYNLWLYENRRLKNGLFFWQHSYESGIDNSPRFTDRSEKEKRDLTRIAAIDLNSYIVLQNQSLVSIAEKLKTEEPLNEYKEDIALFQQKNEDLIKLIQKYLWDEDLGLFFDFDIIDEQRIAINTIASFFPLIAGIPTESQVKKLVQHLENPEEYNTLIPLPTVAMNDRTFVKDTWRGPVWLNTAYLVIKGLERYQKLELSQQFASKLITGVFKTWKNEGSIYEFYDPERFDIIELTRKKGNLYKQITIGNKPVKNFVGWTGLVNTLLIELVKKNNH